MSGGQSQSMLAGRNKSLDFVRGIAIIMVMFWHTPVSKAPNPFLDALTWCGSRFGWAGVDLFFVLSGFLIGGLIFREVQKTGEFDSKRFLLRRGLKIWPQYYVCVAYYALATYLQQKPFDTFLWQNLLHIQNFTGTAMNHTWSLAVEEHFYLLLALGIGAWLKKKGQLDYGTFSWLVVGVILFSFTTRVGLSLYNPVELAAQWYTPARMDALLVGVWIAATMNYKPELFKKLGEMRYVHTAIVILGMAAIPHFQQNSFWFDTVLFSLTTLVSASVLLLAFCAKPGVGFWGKIQNLAPYKWMAWIGVYSYGIYLWHVPSRFTNALNNRFNFEQIGSPEIGWLIHYAVYFTEVILTGVIMTRLIEWPMLKIRDRWMPPKIDGAIAKSEAATQP